jgi:hypothetical protein
VLIEFLRFESGPTHPFKQGQLGDTPHKTGRKLTVALALLYFKVLAGEYPVA